MRITQRLFVTLLVAFATSSLSYGQGLTLCRNQTDMLWADAPYQNSINILHHEDKLFRTNPVCGATSYTWTVGDGASMTTTSPSVLLRGRDLVWLPAGGCYDFNKKWTSYNPLFNKKYPCNWPGSHPLGYYTTSLTVKANNSSSSVTLPVIVDDVEVCIDVNECNESGGLGGF